MGSAQIHHEGLARLEDAVAVHRDRDLSRRGPRRERDRTRGREVVAARGRGAVGGCVVHSHGHAGRHRQGDRDLEARLAGVALGDRRSGGRDRGHRHRRGARPLEVAAARAPQHAGARGARQVVGHDAARRRAHHHLEVRVGVDVGEGGRAEAAVPVVAEGRGQAHAVELVALGSRGCGAGPRGRPPFLGHEVKITSAWPSLSRSATTGSPGEAEGVPAAPVDGTR